MDSKTLDSYVVSETYDINKHNTTQKLDLMIEQINNKAELLEQTDKNGRVIGSGWALQAINKLNIDIFETKPLRGSSYIPTPEK